MKGLTWLSPQDPVEHFPPVERALREPSGLLAAGGDLSAERLVAAYRRGIFPWFSPGEPILWWSPDPRELLYPAEFKLSRSLAKTLRSGRYTVRRNSAFAQVIGHCAAPRAMDSGTWISSAMQAAYVQLHRLGVAHSFETWQDEELVGGLYGLRVGGVFCGESMFSRRSDASKVALQALISCCGPEGIEVVDCQMPSPHLRSLGSRPVSRGQFLAHLASPDATD
jgi:leucyl/phenylalanyl-tRNA--protein transferase